ncbi:N-acetylmuramoyl-L-alanine amidase (plasmid) [Erwinia sp. E602]|uniref:N-acetylmuramoyl-L-alanine amidase n=1 Tax=Erwinia sp. E602 TaxID=2675378 RepID=UPI001BABEB3E|nr:N-acetylmuramoyl-L-alanine amidase [Erwinia sp. E602]QUG73657.1 N-acetylmuramoyl-L-alanine amidase [Erwinia sp. E602]
MYTIDYNSYRSIAGFNRRVRFLVLHYTAENFRDSVTSLTGKATSVHYLIPDPSEATWIAAGYKTLKIFNLVDENERAWHAGVSSWAGRSNLNDTSIGIEIVNLATENNGVFTFPPYNPQQIEAVKQLALNIIQRYPDLSPVNVVGHSDIAPGRKSDPGALFPWKALYDAGVGAWYDDATKQKYQTQFCNTLPQQADIIAKLQKYGYDTSGATTPAGYQNLIRAFQLHFRPSNYCGCMDGETTAILWALVEKYF